MGEQKKKIADVCRDTGLHRNTINGLYHETASRVDLNVISTLCKYFNCEVADMFEYQQDK